MERLAVIIKHPFRDYDYRVDIYDTDMTPEELRQYCMSKMLGPFEILKVTTPSDVRIAMKPEPSNTDNDTTL